MKNHFRFVPGLWLGNRALRACSPAARGFWMDLLCLCYPSGYLTLPTGAPLSDDQISRMVGEPVKLVRAWIKELGDAGIFDISQDGKLCSSRMVKEANFAARAKVAGEKGQKLKKAKAAITPQQERERKQVADFLETGPGVIAKVDKTHTTETHGAPPAPAAAAAPKGKAVEWWKTPAGWVRMGNQQALSMRDDEAFEDFQIRVAARLPFGRHLDVLSVGQVRAVEAAIPKDPNAKKDEA